jgi:hypothetical protein
VYCQTTFAELSVKLYEAAHYYEIEDLKKICKDILPFTVNKENAVELFNWACIYEENDLKIRAWNIIKR